MIWSIRQLIVVGAILGLLALTTLFTLYIVNVLFLIFAGVVISIFLNGCGQWVSRHAYIARKHLPTAAAVAIVIILIIAFFAGAIWFMEARITEQLSELQISIPQVLNELTSGKGHAAWTRMIGNAGTSVIGRLKPFEHISNWLVDVVVIAFISVYLALQPSVYRNGLLQLFPGRSRATAADAMDQLRHTLWRWFIGRIIGMAAIGLLVFGAMRAISFPLSFSLGLIAGIFEFVPYAGAIVSSIPALLLAIPLGTGKLWLVAILYLFVHGIDGYVILPLVERRAVRIPPALTISVQVAMFVTVGLLGVLVADPLTASLMVLMQRFWLNTPGQQPGAGTQDVEPAIRNL